MNFGRDIGQGLSRSFQQVGQQAPQQMQNERMSMQQAAMDMMRQKQQQAQFESQQHQQRLQQDAAQKQRDIMNNLAERRFQFEQGKFAQQNPQNLQLTPEQQQENLALDQKNKLQTGLAQFEGLFSPIKGQSRGKNIPIEKVQELFSKGLSHTGKDLVKFKGTNKLQKYLENLSGKFSDPLQEAGIPSKFLTQENLPYLLDSDSFNDFLEKEGYRTKKDQDEIKEIFTEYGSRLPSIYTLTSDPLAKKLGATGGVTNLGNISDVFQGVLSQKDVRKALLENIIKPVYSSPHEKNPISPEDIQKYYDEIQRDKLGQQQIQSQASQNQIQNSQEQLPQNTQMMPELSAEQSGNLDNNNIQSQLLKENNIPEEEPEIQEKQIKQRNEIINKSVDQEIDNNINQLMSEDIQKRFTQHYGQSPQETQKQIERQTAQIAEAREPIRKIAQTLANVMDNDPEILRKPEFLAAFESEHPREALLAALPANLFLMMGGEKTFAAAANLAKKGVAEGFIWKTALNAAANGSVSKLQGESFIEGAKGSIEGDLLGGAIGKSFNIGKAAATGFKEGGVKGAVKASGQEFKESFPGISKNIKEVEKETFEKGANKLSQDLMKDTEVIAKQKAKEIFPEVEEVLEKNGINLKRDFDKEITEDVQETIGNHYKKASENYAKSAEYNKPFTKDELKGLHDEAINTAQSLEKETLKEDKIGAKKVIDDLFDDISNVKTPEDAKDLIQKFNAKYSKSDQSPFQKYYQDFIAPLEKLIEKVDNGAFKEANRHFTNFKKTLHGIGVDKAELDAFHLPEAIKEFGGRKDLAQLGSMGSSGAKSVSNALKNPKLQNLDIAGEKALSGTIDKRIKQFIDNPDNAGKKLSSELDQFADQFKKHPELKEKYEKVAKELEISAKEKKALEESIEERVYKNGEFNLNKYNPAELAIAKEQIGEINKELKAVNNPAQMREALRKLFKSEGKPTIDKFLDVLAGIKHFAWTLPRVGFLTDMIGKSRAKKQLTEMYNHHLSGSKFQENLIADEFTKEVRKTLISKIEDLNKLEDQIKKKQTQHNFAKSLSKLYLGRDE